MTALNESGLSACVVVPCYNEADRLDVQQFREFLSGHAEIRFLFVDDGSRDGTEKVLKNICQGFPDRCGILSQGKNKGKAEAVRSGIHLAMRSFSPNVVGFWDADLATPLPAILDFLAVFDRDPDVLMVFGARVQLLGRHVERHAMRHYLGRIFATVVSNMLRLPIYDTQCGAKLFRVNEAVRCTFADQFISKWAFDVEILARYLNYFDNDREKLARIIYEYPLERWVDVEGSKVRAKDFWRTILDLQRIKGKYLRKRKQPQTKNKRP